MRNRTRVLIGVSGTALIAALIIVASVTGWVASAANTISGPTPKALPPTGNPSTPCAISPTVGPNDASGSSCAVVPAAVGAISTQAAANAPKTRAGVPAVQPSISNASAQTPAITVQDVTQYAVAHPTSGKIQVTGPITPGTVQFLPAQQVDTQFQTDIGVAPDQLMCMVTLQGTFMLAGPPMRNASGTEEPRIATFHTSYQIYDAHSGSLLMQIVKP